MKRPKREDYFNELLHLPNTYLDKQEEYIDYLECFLSKIFFGLKVAIFLIAILYLNKLL